MPLTSKARLGTLAVVSLAVMLTGCQQSPDAQLQTAPGPPRQVAPGTARSTAAARPTPLSWDWSRTVAVRRGSITETAWLNGRVSGSEEAQLGFATRAVPTTVLVKAGDIVTAGETLVQADANAIEQALKSAQEQLDTSINRSNLNLRQAADKKRQSQLAQDDGIAAAMDGLRRAQDDYQRIAAGASDLDKQTAEVALANARAALQRAQADLSRLTTPPSGADTQLAQQTVVDARLAEREAAAAVQKLTAGPSSLELGTAQQQVADAQLAVTTAQADLDRLSGGPDPAELRSAQTEVDRAKQALDSVSAPLKTDNTSKTDAAAKADAAAASRAASIDRAKVALQDAQDRLTKLKQPPSAAALDAAKNRVASAKFNAAATEDRFATLARGADSIAMDKANAILGAARLKAQQAQDALNKLEAGPSADDLHAVEITIENAQLALDTAQARRDDVYGHPTPAELRDAQNRVASAQAALEKAVGGQPSDSSADDPTLADGDLAKQRATVSDLQRELEGTTLRAPFSGTVISVTAKPNEAIEAGVPAMVLAGSGAALVQAVLPTEKREPSTVSQVSNVGVSSGMGARIEIDGASGPALSGSISSVTNDNRAKASVANINVDWGTPPPAVGSTALIQITLRDHPDVLIVPIGTVRMAAGKPYVELVDQQQVKIQPVMVGVSTESDVEVLSGLNEGQLIVSR